MATAPPTEPGMLAPNSSPARPCLAARCTARGKDAPPPHHSSLSRTTIELSLPARRSTSPVNPSSAISRFEPLPTTATGTSAPRAHASASLTSRNDRAVANARAEPPTRMVVNGASGTLCSSSIGIAPASASGMDWVLVLQAPQQLLPELGDVAGPKGQYHVARPYQPQCRLRRVGEGRRKLGVGRRGDGVRAQAA